MKQETERKQERKKTENKLTEPKKRWYNEDLTSLIEEDLENSLSHGATMADISEEKIEEEQLDEDEVEESVRGYRKENEPQHASQGGNRVADRLRESIYDRFRKLIK